MSDPEKLSNGSSMSEHQRNDGTHEPKKRRVTRACDNCRSKKVKCDGRQPCIHCTVYSFNCTYDRPNIRNKKSCAPLPSVPQSTAVLKSIAMNKQPSMFTINDNLALSQNIVNLLLPKFGLNFLDDKPQNFDFARFQKIVNGLRAKNPSNLNLNEITEKFLGDSITNPSPSGSVDSSSSNAPEESMETEIKIVLPPKDIALKLIYTTWDKACVLFRFYHRPSLLEEVDLLYSMDPLQYTDRQQKFLPFMYSILACGSLFSKTSSNHNEKNNTLEDDGFNYFLEARKLIDISNVSDIPAIQTIVMMIMYLQCSARLSTCYSYIGIALRSALKEGLHRNLEIFQSRRKLDPIEIDTRKRLFYTIYKMDIYINSLLGLPGSISEDEFDQDFPIELDDELITRKAFLVDMQNGRLSSSACANHHTKLTMIHSRIVKDLYPIKVQSKSGKVFTSQSIHETVTKLEGQLKTWLDNVPEQLRPMDPSNSDRDSLIPEKFRLANYYLHVSFLNCQISLYRPFIHYISNGNLSEHADLRSLIRGRNCIKVARLVVKLANKMIDQNLLIGTYWFSMYTIFFSIACLIYYYHFANYNNLNNSLKGINYAGIYFDDDLNISMIGEDIEIGKKVLDHLKNMSNSSLRIYNILNKLFEQLNRKTATSSLKNEGQQSRGSCDDDMVAASLENFDKINQFSLNSSTCKQPPLVSPYQENDVNRNGLLDIFPPRGAAAVDGFTASQNSPSQSVYGFRADNQNVVPNSEEKPSFTAVPQGTQKDNTLNDFSSAAPAYVPGVIDAIDTQIFGRLLPPYMLEENARRADEQNAKVFYDDNGDTGLLSNNYSDFENLNGNDYLGSLDPF